MTQLALQEAAATIVAAYLSNNEVGGAGLPALIAAVGRALAQAPEAVPSPEPVASRSWRRARFAVASDVEPRRIEHVDQIEMLWHDEGKESQDEEGAEHLMKRVPEPERTVAAAMPRARSSETPGTDQAGDTEAYGVTITRLPEVRRGRRRLS